MKTTPPLGRAAGPSSHPSWLWSCRALGSPNKETGQFKRSHKRWLSCQGPSTTDCQVRQVRETREAGWVAESAWVFTKRERLRLDKINIHLLIHSFFPSTHKVPQGLCTNYSLLLQCLSSDAPMVPSLNSSALNSSPSTSFRSLSHCL